MAYFFKEDKLGSLANLHLAYCDNIGKLGPFDDKAKFLSHL